MEDTYHDNIGSTVLRNFGTAYQYIRCHNLEHRYTVETLVTFE